MQGKAFSCWDSLNRGSALGPSPWTPLGAQPVDPELPQRLQFPQTWGVWNWTRTCQWWITDQVHAYETAEQNRREPLSSGP